MRITAPGFACPLARPFTAGGQHRLGVSVLSAWSLDGAPLPVAELWKRFVRAAGAEAILDQGLPKSASEWLLVGHAYASEPVTHLAVSVETLGSRKVLNVVGDRVWKGGVPTLPAPFTTMPLGWGSAFGGAGFAENPLGKGYAKGDAEGLALPNVEAHGRMIDSPSARPSPAGFGAFSIDWPQRTKGLGTYDAAWFERDYPGFARDCDWRVHNAAPEDQRFDEPLAPGQRFILHNLVSGSPRVELELPRVVARCFTYIDEAAPTLDEVPLSLRTVWLVPDEDLLVLVATGSRAIESMLASEVKGLVLALDASANPRDAAHYARALAARLDRTEDGPAQALDDRPLMPEGIDFPDYGAQAEDLTLPDRAGALEANLYEGAKLRREEALRLFADAGFEGGEELFPLPPPPSGPSKAPIGEQVRAALEEAKEQEAATREKMAAMREDARAELAAAGLDPSFLDAGPTPGPPRVLASVHIATLEAVVREGRAAGMPMEVFERQLQDPAFHRDLIEKERKGREGYRLMAHRTEATPEEPSLDQRMELRELVEAAIRDRTSLSEWDLTCADLNELDLSGMDLRGAWLEGAELQKADLSGALLERAVLAKADLSEARLERTVLRYANLGRARLLWTRFEGCDLGEAILAGANLRAAVFARCDLHGADLSEARLEQTRFGGCELSGITLLNMSLAGAEFHACRMSQSSLIEVELDGVGFPRCDLSKAALVTCRGEGVSFQDADLENARFVAGCAFPGADLRGANLSRASLRGTSFEGAIFDEANLRGADLSEARCARARFHKADLREVLATECDLSDASLRGANLMNAVLQGSDLRGADLSDTNLFAADLALVRADERTSLAGALVTRARHKPLRSSAAAGSGEVPT